MNYSTLQTLTPPAMERRMQTASPLSGAIRTAQLPAVLFVAFALKYHYSTASVNGLKWILAPTAFLVEWVSGIKFSFESHAGYMNADNTFLIAASCSGVNFLIISFLMLALGQIWRKRDRPIGWRFLPVSFAAAYAATVVANTVRIDIALRTRQTDIASGWLSYADLHRLEGILVYFGCLLLLYAAAEILRGNANTLAGRLPLPMFVYYATTLGIPVATGAYREAGFWQHSMFVILTPLIVLVPFIALSRLIRVFHQRGAEKHFRRRPDPAKQHQH